MANALYYVMLICIVFLGIFYLTAGQSVMADQMPNNNTTTGKQYESTMKIVDLNSALFPAILLLACGFVVWKVVVGGGE